MATSDGYEPAVWKQMAQELGLQGLHVPKVYGGQGLSFVELAVVLEEMGRALLCAPFLSTVCLAANAMLNGATDAERAELLPRIVSGDSVATLAVAESSGVWDPACVAMEAKSTGDCCTLDGTKLFVTDGHVADLLVVAARLPGSSGEDGVGLYLVDGAAIGLTRTLLPTLDETRKQARLDFAGVHARPLGTPGCGGPALSKTLDQAAVCLASEIVGTAAKALELSVEYAKTRIQFARPIGSFQAVKHRCADMFLDVESARSAAAAAAAVAAEDGGELPVVASLAKAYCSEAGSRVTSEAIHVHGGIGFTWEHDAHLYFKRATSSSVLLGDATRHREMLVRRIGV